VNRNLIAEAVNDEFWQAFRESLKGLSTSRKLHRLHEYFVVACWKREVLNTSDTEFERVQIQLDNYIKALCRGGQLNAGESLQTAVANDWDLQIKS
jgi:hypothetical protein